MWRNPSGPLLLAYYLGECQFRRFRARWRFRRGPSRRASIGDVRCCARNWARRDLRSIPRSPVRRRRPRAAQRGQGPVPTDMAEHMFVCDVCRAVFDYAVADEALLATALLDFAVSSLACGGPATNHSRGSSVVDATDRNRERGCHLGDSWRGGLTRPVRGSHHCRLRDGILSGWSRRPPVSQLGRAMDGSHPPPVPLGVNRERGSLRIRDQR